MSRPRGYRRQVSKKLIGRQVSVRQVSRASIVSGVKGPRSFKRQMSLRQKSIFGRSMSKILWQCMSGHVCLGVVSLGVKKDPPVVGWNSLNARTSNARTPVARLPTPD